MHDVLLLFLFDLLGFGGYVMKQNYFDSAGVTNFFFHSLSRKFKKRKENELTWKIQIKGTISVFPKKPENANFSVSCNASKIRYVFRARFVLDCSVIVTDTILNLTVSWLVVKYSLVVYNTLPNGAFR